MNGQNDGCGHSSGYRILVWSSVNATILGYQFLVVSWSLVNMKLCKGCSDHNDVFVKIAHLALMLHHYNRCKQGVLLRGFCHSQIHGFSGIPFDYID